MKALGSTLVLIAVSWSVGIVIRLVLNPNDIFLSSTKEALYPHDAPISRRVKAVRQTSSEDSVFVHVDKNTTLTMDKRTALWVGSYPLKSLVPKAKHRKLSIVIAHCNKPLNWIQDYVHDTVSELGIVVDRILIVSKCGKPVVGAMPGSTILRFPNLGRCDHTYSQWMGNITEKWIQEQLQQGNSLHVTMSEQEEDNKNHFVLFIKDNDYRAQTHNYRSFREVLEIVEGPSGFACTEPPMQLPGLSLSLYHNYTQLRSFSIMSYNGTQKKEPEEEKIPSVDCKGKEHCEGLTNETKETSAFGAPSNDFKSKYSNLGEWIDDLALEPLFLQGTLSSATSSMDIRNPAITSMCYGCIFATTKHQLLKAAVADHATRGNRKNAFHRMAESLARQDNTEEGHFVERIWGALLSNPLDWTHVLDDLKKLLPPRIVRRNKLGAQTTENAGKSSKLHEGNSLSDNGNDSIHWKDLFAPYPIQMRCQGDFMPHCGVQVMTGKSFQKMSNGTEIKLVAQPQ